MTADPTLFAELENAITHGSSTRRADILLQVTDLFVDGSDQFSDDAIRLFDDIISRLVFEIETKVRILLARRLAPLDKAPINITRILAKDDEIEVAAPILEQSLRLDDTVIVEIARTKSQEHLLAISRREVLSECITDVLVIRGDQSVLRSAANNAGAKFSKEGFRHLVKVADGNDTLAACVGSRPDIPHHLFIVLLATASEEVRKKLVAENSHAGNDIDRTVISVTDDIRNDARAQSSSYAAAEILINSIQKTGQLTERTVQRFCEDGNFLEGMVALARICNVPIDVVEEAMTQEKPEGILVLARAAKMPWTTAKVLLSYRARQRGLPLSTIEQSMATFERLSPDTAQRIVGFYRTRKSPAPLNKRAS